MDSIHYIGNDLRWKASLSLEALSAELPPFEESAEQQTQRPRTAAQWPFAAFPKGKEIATIPACPFNEANTSSPEFLEKLRHAWQTGEPPPKADGHLRIALGVPPYWLGEGATAARLLKIFHQRDVECCICSPETVSAIAKIAPDIYWTLAPEIPIAEKVPTLMALTRPCAEGTSAFKTVLQCNYILYTIPDIDQIRRSFAANGRTMRDLAVIHYSVPKTNFCDTQKQRLFYGSANWDDRRRKVYIPLYEHLSTAGYFDAYGPKGAWNHMHLASYRGEASDEALQPAMRNAGVTLVLHSDMHLLSGTHTARIFEAAAASCVIICDMHPWIMEHFGNSVLYVDQNASPEEMFRQIDGHMKWIHEHPQEAIELARRSHSIFVENFALEGEVEKIEKFIREILAEKADN
jgi:hypothetical protein